VVCFSGGENLWFTLFQNILGKKAATVMGEMFLPEPNPKCWKWRLKRQIRRFLFRKVDRFVVYSTAERQLWADYLGYDVSRFKTVFFATNILAPERYPEGLYLPNGHYGFAAGSSERDYKTFFEAVKGIPYPFVVVARKKQLEGLDIPSNVTLHCDIPWEQYVELLKDSAFTVVPLHIRQRSTGQVVLLEGYAFGKPTVATRCIGTEDYVLENETGYFCEAYQPESMKAAIQKMLASDENRRQMGKQALEKARAEFSPLKFLESYLAVLEEAVGVYRKSKGK